MSASHFAEHFFRHEYGRLCAVLTRRVGSQHIEAVEDAVQSALLVAWQSWPRDAQPDDPSAWLYRVAHNKLLETLRARSRHDRLLEGRSIVVSTSGQPWIEADATNDLLRMLFVACDERIPLESQLVFSLKVLCGFDIAEVSERLCITEANTYKRLSRAREHLRSYCESLDEPVAFSAERRGGVLAVIYLLFTEGYLSSHPKAAIRDELCAEAIRLARLLAAHPVGQTSETFALLALMHFHAARAVARRDALGGLLLLEEQDRSLWDGGKMQEGLAWLEKSAVGNEFSRYHAEAGIAVEHCMAPCLTETRWDRIVECYEQIEHTSPSPLHTLNRAVAVAEWQGAQAGLAVLRGLEPPTWLEGSYLWSAVLSDLHRRAGNEEKSVRYRDIAIATAPSESIKRALERRLQSGKVGGG